MKTTIATLFLALCISAPLDAQTTNSELKRALTDKVEQLMELVQQLPLDPPQARVVRAGEDLQAALDAGGTIELQGGAVFTAARFTLSKSGTVLKGNGASLVATAGPALYVPPGIDDIQAMDITATSTWSGAVVQCGDNGPTQTAAAQVPQRIAFANVTVPTHRGKRGFELNCSATLTDSKALDIWSPALQDSQAIWVGNTCGPVTATRGEFVAASENILIGGDVLKVTDCPGGVAAGLTFDGVSLSKPEAWRTDGVSRGVKNLFEVKAGRRVKLSNARLSGSWKAGQDGWAIVITPKNGQYIQDVLIEHVIVDRCGGAIQLLGLDYNSVTPQATSSVVVRHSRFECSKATFGGRGIFALLSGGVLDVSVDDVDFRGDGTSIVVSDTTSPQGPFVIRNSRMPTGTYGISANGASFGNAPGASYAGREIAVILEANSFALDGMSSTGQTAFKRNFPGNVWVTRAELDAMR